MIRVKDQVDSRIDSKFSRAHCRNAHDTLVVSAFSPLTLGGASPYICVVPGGASPTVSMVVYFARWMPPVSRHLCLSVNWSCSGMRSTSGCATLSRLVVASCQVARGFANPASCGIQLVSLLQRYGDLLELQAVIFQWDLGDCRVVGVANNARLDWRSSAVEANIRRSSES